MDERKEKSRPITRRTGQLLRQHGIKPKKALGQNFLTDPRVLGKMVAAANIDCDTGVLEVGPGMGSLTEQLAEAAGAVVAIEIDQRLLPVLEELFTHDTHVTIRHGDILATDLEALKKSYFKKMKRIVAIANLPYYITSPVMMRLLECRRLFAQLVLMIQKEVAERMMAKPGSKDYGLLTVAVNYYAVPERIAHVPPHVFIPRPRVESTVIRLTPHVTPPVAVESSERLFQVVRAGFRERRKTLANNLKAHLVPDWDKARVNEWLESLQIDPSRRAETLSLEEFGRLSNAFCVRQDGPAD